MENLDLQTNRTFEQMSFLIKTSSDKNQNIECGNRRWFTVHERSDIQFVEKPQSQFLDGKRNDFLENRKNS